MKFTIQAISVSLLAALSAHAVAEPVITHLPEKKGEHAVVERQREFVSMLCCLGFFG